MTAPTRSCLYVGWVRHRRHEPVTHRLRMGLFMVYLDLDELPELFDGWRGVSARSRALAEFRRADHLGDPSRPLADEIRALARSRGAKGCDGPVRLLTTLRCLGHRFDPVSFHYCFDRAGGRVEAVVAEVTNTPWGETHAYALIPDPARAPGSIMRGVVAKEFHVSPFMGMGYSYAWRLTEPGERLAVQIDSARDGRTAFDATLSLARRPLTPASLAQTLARHPLQSAHMLGAVYAHGASVWAKGASYFPNPSGAPAFGRARRRHAQRSRARAGER